MSEVVWTDIARDHLADIWVAATPDERNGFEQTILRLERDLTKDPLAVGESRAGKVRVVVRSSLVFWFDFDEECARILKVTRPIRK